MRFGKCCWSQSDEGVKHDVLLVEKKLDEARERDGEVFHGLDEPEFSNLAKLALVHSTRLNGLLDRLSKAGVLSQQDVDELRASSDPAWNDRHDLMKVEDLDRW
jgi:hypothetical protein